jgi:apolipoprotein D and lipocalin family protein
MLNRVIFAFSIMFASVSLRAASVAEPLTTVPFVDVERYMGTWYEIGSIPQWFSRGCFNTWAEYTLRDDGRVDVLNQCHKGSPTGRVKQAKGIARVVNDQTNAELKVSFFWPFEGDYWIVELGDNYEYAVVSEPGRSTLWILSRTPEMDRDVLDGVVERLKTVHGFDMSLFKFTRG